MFRIPLARIYRAFPELDPFSDAQCERFVQRVRATSWYRPSLWSLLAVTSAVSMAGAGIVNVALDDRLFWLSLNQRWADNLQIGSWLLSLLAVPAFAGLITRDLLLRGFLRRAISMRLDRVRCRTCRYILIGQVQRDGVIRCPECSTQTTLRDLGITADDLIPPQAGVDSLTDTPDAAPAS